MAISDLTITNEELEGKKISDIVGDTLVGTPAQNKQKFDDYSDVLKEKFNDLIDELVSLSPQNNVLEGVQVNGTDLSIIGKKVNIPLVTANNDGAMSIADKNKLNGLNKTTSVAGGNAGIPTSDAVNTAIQRVAGVAPDINDYVVSYEKNVSASHGDFYWNRRKWASGVCEIWTNVPVEYSFGNVYLEIANFGNGYGIYKINASNLTDYSVTPFKFPSNTFNVAPTYESVSLTYASVRPAWLTMRGTSQHYIEETNAYDILTLRKPTEGSNYFSLTVYVVGTWK